MITEYHMKALDRAIEFLRATGHANESADDPYGGLMWHDDAECLEKLRAAIEQERQARERAEHDIARHVAIAATGVECAEVAEQRVRTLEAALQQLRAAVTELLLPTINEMAESLPDRHSTKTWSVVSHLQFSAATEATDEALAARPQAVDAQPDEADEQPPEQAGIKESLTTDNRLTGRGVDALDEATAIAQATGQYPAEADEALAALDWIEHWINNHYQRGVDGPPWLTTEQGEVLPATKAVRRALQRPRVPDEVRALPQELRDFAQNFILAEQYETAEQIGEMAASARRAIRASEGSDDE